MWKELWISHNWRSDSRKSRHHSASEWSEGGTMLVPLKESEGGVCVWVIQMKCLTASNGFRWRTALPWKTSRRLMWDVDSRIFKSSDSQRKAESDSERLHMVWRLFLNGFRFCSWTKKTHDWQRVRLISEITGSERIRSTGWLSIFIRTKSLIGYYLSFLPQKIQHLT
mgnify:CR=1 FL=1